MILKDLRISPLRNILTSISMLVGIIAMIGSVLVGTLGKEYLISVNQQHGKEFLICSLGSQSDSSRYDDVNYILKTIDESDYLTK